VTREKRGRDERGTREGRGRDEGGRRWSMKMTVPISELTHLVTDSSWDRVC
jgi:hypothetical protein